MNHVFLLCLTYSVRFAQIHYLVQTYSHSLFLGMPSVTTTGCPMEMLIKEDNVTACPCYFKL